MKKIKYVQLEPAAVLLDINIHNFTAKEFGCYWILMMHLYCNGGKMQFDMKQLKKLCNCRTGFEKVWKKIEKKFQIKNDFVRHERVSKELREAKRRLQVAQESGLRGAKKRWGAHSNPIGEPIAKVTEGNVIEEKERKELRIRKDNSISPLQSLASSSSFRSANSGALSAKAFKFHESLLAIIRPRNQSDRTSFRNIGNWLLVGIQAGRFNEEIFPRVLEYAAEAVKGKSRKPAAVFTSLLKRELEYKP